MKKPLNYAILSQFLTKDEASADMIIEALKPEYGNYRALKRPSVVETLMAAEANGLLDESHFNLNENGELQVFYKLNDYGRNMITNFIGA